MRVSYQPLSKEVLTCSYLNLRRQMLKMFTARRDLRSGCGGLSFCYLSRLGNLQPPALHNLWVLIFRVSPPVVPGNTKAMCRIVLCRLHKDARCPVCLHLVTARSIFQQAHVLGAPVLLVFTLTPPSPPLACHHPPSLSLNSATQEQSPVACSASVGPVNVPAAVFLCLQ